MSVRHFGPTAADAIVLSLRCVPADGQMHRMWPDRRFLDLVGIELPIVQAPMAGAMDAELAAAVSAAGGLGSLPCAMLGPAQIRQEVERIRAQTAKPINLNFFCHVAPALNNAREASWRERLAPYYRDLAIDPTAPVPTSNRAPFDDALCEVVLELRPKVVSFVFGLPAAALLERVKREDFVVVGSATTVQEARWLAAHGVDAVIAQGVEAGGHRGPGRRAGASAADRGCRRCSGDRGRRHHGCARHRGRLRARRGGGADGYRFPALSRGEDFPAASRRAAIGTGGRDRTHQPDDRPAGARLHQPGHARDRPDQRSGTRVSARRRRAGSAAPEGRSYGLRRFFAHVVGPGGGAWPRATGRRAHAKTRHRGAGADAEAGRAVGFTPSRGYACPRGRRSRSRRAAARPARPLLAGGLPRRPRFCCRWPRS